jgi:hypothetical protein
MSEQSMRKFRWFWPWQDDVEEAWLGAMSSEGWHLSKLGFGGIYQFLKGSPSNFMYRLDFRSNSRKEKDQYIQLFQDAGWEYIGEMFFWQYFRKPVKSGEEAEIFTDNESKILKYHRVMALYTILTFFLTLLFQRVNTDFSPSDAASKIMFMVYVFLEVGIGGYFIVSLVGILWRIGKLTSRR